jgi:hypothetical protein
MLSLGTLVYLIARTVPRISDTAQTLPKENYFDRLIKKLPIEKADALASSLMEKLLRKLKVVVLKLDNLVTKHLRSLKPAEKKEELERPSIFEKKQDENSAE